MKRTAIFIISSLFLISCSSGVNIKKSQVKYFDSSFSAIVENKPFMQKGQGFKDSTFLDFFNINGTNNDSISIHFTREKKLQVSYLKGGQKREATFKGQFVKKGYYEFYFSNQKLDIPPFIPFLRSKHEINRIILALNLEGELVVDVMWDYTTSILLFLGAGDSRRQQSFFKIRQII